MGICTSVSYTRGQCENAFLSERKTVSDLLTLILLHSNTIVKRGPRGRDHMVVAFTSTYASNAYHH